MIVNLPFNIPNTAFVLLAYSISPFLYGSTIPFLYKNVLFHAYPSINIVQSILSFIKMVHYIEIIWYRMYLFKLCFKFHLCSCLINFFHLVYIMSFTHLFIHSAIIVHLSCCFQCFTVSNNFAVDILYLSSGVHAPRCLQGLYLEVELLCHIMCIHFNFTK